jgi:hypothetical protein
MPSINVQDPRTSLFKSVYDLLDGIKIPTFADIHDAFS